MTQSPRPMFQHPRQLRAQGNEPTAPTARSRISRSVQMERGEFDVSEHRSREAPLDKIQIQVEKYTNLTRLLTRLHAQDTQQSQDRPGRGPLFS